MAEITTKRVKPVLVHDGHMYRFDKRSADDGQFWRCLNFLKSGCPRAYKDGPPRSFH